MTARTPDEIKEIELLAIAGDANAQYRFASLNLHGGLDRPLKAIQWYESAVQQGHKNATIDLAHAYYSDQDIAPDWRRSLELAETLSKEEPAMAMLAAELYMNGQNGGITNDFAKAHELVSGVLGKDGNNIAAQKKLKEIESILDSPYQAAFSALEKSKGMLAEPAPAPSVSRGVSL